MMSACSGLNHEEEEEEEEGRTGNRRERRGSNSYLQLSQCSQVLCVLRDQKSNGKSAQSLVLAITTCNHRDT